MDVVSKTMYHFHKNGIHDDEYFPQNEIIVDDNYESHYGLVLKYFTTGVKNLDGNMVPYNNIIDDYFNEEKDLEYAEDLLKGASTIINGMNIFLREKALEEVRVLKYPNLPSRLHSMWLTDKKGLSFWRKALTNPQSKNPHQLALFKVNVTGNLFKTSDYLIPDDNRTYEAKLWQAHMYWKPDYSGLYADRSEYLFHGKVKILEKLK